MTIILIIIICGMSFYIYRTKQNKASSSTETKTVTDTNDYIAHVSGSFKCDSCGASVCINSSDPIIICPFCGARLPEAEKQREDILHATEVEKNRAAEREKMLIEERREKRRIEAQRKSDLSDDLMTIGFFIFILVIIGIIIIIYKSIIKH